MRYRLITVASTLAVLLFVATLVLWAMSYRTPLALPAEVPRGGVIVLNWRGQVVIVHHKASPDPGGSIQALRGTWGTTTAYLTTAYLGHTDRQILTTEKVTATNAIRITHNSAPYLQLQHLRTT